MSNYGVYSSDYFDQQMRKQRRTRRLARALFLLLVGLAVAIGAICVWLYATGE